MKDTWYSSQSQSFNFLKNLASYADTIWPKVLQLFYLTTPSIAETL